MTLLERLWAYLTLGAMGSLWGEASPLLGGLAAHDRRLGLWPVVLAVALGTWLGVLGFYALGRARGKWVRKRWPKARPLILRSVALVRRHPWRASLASRFAYGVRIALPIACGIGRVPVMVYAIGTGISSLAWAIVFTVLGWSMGLATQAFLGQVREFESAIGVVVVLLVVVAYLVLHRRHVERKTIEVLDDYPVSLPRMNAGGAAAGRKEQDAAT
jgi:membrane protein DedA with SNARE-associated domain